MKKNSVAKCVTRLVLLIVMVATVAYSHNVAAQTGIEGSWTAKGLTITISGSVATISSLSDPKYPQKILKGRIYENIQKIGSNTWKAERFAWKHYDKNVENGRWDKLPGTLTLTLSNNSLVASGHWTFSRVGTLHMCSNCQENRQWKCQIC